MKTLIVIILFHYLLLSVDVAVATVKRQCVDVIVKSKLFVKCRIVEVKDRAVVCNTYPFTDHMDLTTWETLCTYYDNKIHKA